MGGGSSTANPKQQVSTADRKNMNKSIEERMMGKKKEEESAVKVLLLGAGECGKSTILKQMKILHLGGFKAEEMEAYVHLCRRNALDAMQQLTGACVDLGIPHDNDAMRERARKVLEVQPSDNIPLELGPDIKELWTDGGVKKALARENEFHLLDSCKYFLNDIDRLYKDGYEPTTEDALRARLMTTGILETRFEIDGITFRVYDVGGQRGERKKWIHCFDDVTAILFIASLSEYDQCLADDRTRNRLVESLDLFEGIINLPWFQKASTILFLNKNDLFEEKVLRVDIGDFHEDYDGGLNYDLGLEYIQNEYMDRNESETKTLYCHVTDATNTQNIEFVWKSVKHIILENKLTSSGLQMC